VKSIDKVFDDLALLARDAAGWCVHNPNVAAAIYDVHGQFVASGSHRKKLSNDHAEIVALNAAGVQAQGGTLYVSLEPCNHSGVTGPCTEAIKNSGIKKVVYAVSDPNPIASGGSQALRDAGIEVIHERSEMLEFEQRGWLHRVSNGRPLITAKVAVTLDGYIAAFDGTSRWITSAESRQDLQHLRAQMGAIITSTETFLHDQPSLLPRIEGAPTPYRIVMGRRNVHAPGFTHLASRDVSEFLTLLNKEGINQALVEAGGVFLSALMRANLIDELVIYQAPKLLGSGKRWIENLGINSLSEAMEWELLGTYQLGPDVKTHYRRADK
jgi:diaminohydroxyphosphoribosylaminopyrimidine deaminase/5-amino-6-(5-phosphoribosylamino)uracil reductase